MIYSKDACSNLGLQAVTKSYGMTNKLLYYANELICIVIQCSKQECQAHFCEALTEFINKECML